VISVVLNASLEIRLGICIYKIYFCIDPMAMLLSHQAVRHILQQNYAHAWRWCLSAMKQCIRGTAINYSG